MQLRRPILLLVFFLQAFGANAEEEIAQLYDYPPPPTTVELFSNIWDDLGIFVRRVDPVDNWKPLLGIGLSTLFLVRYDEAILTKTQSLARDIGLLSESMNGREATIVFDPSIWGFDIPFRIPNNLVSTFYFMGDAPIHIALYSGFASYGYLNDSRRARNTASQIAEGVLVTATVIQILKRSFGRESPFKRTQAGGRWDLFPNQIDYAFNVASYDAMPAGHVATAITTTHILAGNYPEYRYIKPLGYTLTTLIGLSMIINGVHWAGDYPLGLATGYLVADIVLNRAKAYRDGYQTKKSPRLTNRPQLDLLIPFSLRDGTTGLSAIFRF